MCIYINIKCWWFSKKKKHKTLMLIASLSLSIELLTSNLLSLKCRPHNSISSLMVWKSLSLTPSYKIDFGLEKSRDKYEIHQNLLIFFFCCCIVMNPSELIINGKGTVKFYYYFFFFCVCSKVPWSNSGVTYSILDNAYMTF